MIKVTLSAFERGHLEHTFKTTPNRRLRHRCQAMLMAARGRRHHHIADDLGISPRTLQRWLHAYQSHGLDGLTIRWGPGRTPHLPAALAPEILTWIKAGPVGCGLEPIRITPLHGRQSEHRQSAERRDSVPAFCPSVPRGAESGSSTNGSARRPSAGLSGLPCL